MLEITTALVKVDANTTVERQFLYQFSNSWLQGFKQLHITYKLVLARVVLQMSSLPILK